MSEQDDKPVRVYDGVFYKRGVDGWCENCGWADFTHIIGGNTGNLICRAADVDAYKERSTPAARRGEG